MAARYRILRKIADGGMAEIFLATQHGAEGFERRVVLKRILAALLADPKFRNMMIDEAHVAMSLNHSNIVQVLDLGQSKGRYFLVLELVDGWDLNQLLARVKNAGQTLPPEIALYFIAEVCRALHYAHARTRDGKALGIVHRDVSPHNVLVSEQGEVKLTDFGIAKAMGRRERTGQGVIKGKLAFMSPEQASGAPLDGRSDLFSVGTMLYLMFTGRRPFDAPTDLETILRVQQGDFPAADTVKPDLPPEIVRIIDRAMKKAPSDRYQSAEEMLVDVEAAQRSVYRPAGQTELKRWLAELGRKDGAPPISRSAPLPSDGDDESLELVDEDIVFEEVSGDSGAVGGRGKTSVSVQRAAESLRASGPQELRDTREDSPAASAEAQASVVTRSPRRRRWLMRTFALGAAAAGVVALARGAWKGPSKVEPTAARPVAGDPPSAGPAAGDPPPAAPVASPAPPPAAPEPAPAPVAAPEPDAASVAVAPEQPDAGSLSAQTSPDAEGEEDEDEEALLKRQEPDVTEKVIGEEDGAAVAPPPKPERRPQAAKPAVAKAPPAPPPPPVREEARVRIESRPPGAVIRIGQKVFGRAPMTLRFNSGITYEVTLVKSGYATTKKQFTVSRRKNQVVAVSMKKKSTAAPKKKRSLFQRIFGR